VFLKLHVFSESAELNSINARQHQVQQEQSRRVLLGLCHYIFSSSSPPDRESSLRKVIANQSGNILIIFNQDDCG
jgi:hypothetical protein